MPYKSIEYNGVDIRIWEQSIKAGCSEALWLGRPVEDHDIRCVKGIIDVGRESLAQNLRELRLQKRTLLGER